MQEHAVHSKTLLRASTLGRALTAACPGAYGLALTIVFLLAMVWNLRMHSILACPAARYSPEYYLAYCQADGYGDYDHGALWLDLEPGVRRGVEAAQVLFLGNSRLEFGFSGQSTSDWFARRHISYYLLGFGYAENFTFARELFKRYSTSPRFVVINADRFFEDAETLPTRSLKSGDTIAPRYLAKRRWQSLHREICQRVPSVCRDEYAIFRSRLSGAYVIQGHEEGAWPGDVTYDDEFDHWPTDGPAAMPVALGERFLQTLHVDRDCVVVTMVPSPRTELGVGRSIAAGLGVQFVAPEVPGLRTFDGSHLDPPSAERWSSVFLKEIEPAVRKCVGRGNYAAAQN